jgi:hypothetical protein
MTRVGSQRHKKETLIQWQNGQMNNKPMNNKIHAKGVYSSYGNTTDQASNPGNGTQWFHKYGW